MSHLKGTISLFFASVVALAPAMPARAQTPLPEKSPPPGTCIPIAVEMVDDVDSSRAKAGDFFRFETVTATLRSDGYRLAIPAHALGYGIVSIASAARAGGHAGTLVLEPRYIVLPGGAHLQVVLDHVASNPQSRGNTGNLPDYLGAIPILGPAIGIFNVFHRGKDVEVKAGTKFAVFASDDPSVARCQHDPE